MKKLIFLLLMLFPFNVKAISASSSIVMDLNNGRVLYQNNIYEERLIASISKIMSAIVTIEYADLDKVVTVGEEILEAYGSAIYIELGEKLTLRDLLYGLMLRSGNDAAVVIAKNVAGNMENFAMLMNEMASKIGMNDTYFYNAHGLEESDGAGNTSTAYDMALLTKYAMANAEFREIFGTKKYSVKTNYKTYSWTSKNKLIHSYDFITGGKTGFTEKARRTLVTTGSNNNINLVVVTLNDPNDFADHITLYEKIFREYEAVKVIDKDNFSIKEDNVYSDDTLYVSEDIYVPVTSSEKKDLRIEYQLYKNNTYIDGDKVGSVKVYLRDELIREENIYVLVDEGDTKKLTWWEKFLRWIKW